MASVRRAAPAILLVVAAACDIPTDVPIVEQRWVLPVESTSVGLSDFLPTGVREVSGGFVLDLDDVTRSRTLGQLCPSCQAANGLVAPKPAFNGAITVQQSLPADVTRATLGSASIGIDITNDFSFDPLRPGGSNGSLTITLRNGAGGAQLGSITITGAQTAFPSGSTLTRSIPISGTLSEPLFAQATVNSPAGDPVLIDVTEALVLTASTTNLSVASAWISVAGRAVTLDPVAVDVEDLDETVVDQIQSGSVILEITNPFGVAVSGRIGFETPNGEFFRTVTVTAEPTSTVEVEYSAADLQQILGQPNVFFVGDFSVDTDSPTIAVTAGQAILIDAKLGVTLRLGD